MIILIQLLNRLGLIFLAIGGIIVGFGLMVFITCSFIALSPGLLLYYMSIRMGIEKLKEDLNTYEEYDENGLKIININANEQKNPSNTNGFVKTNLRKIRNLLDKYLD